MRFLKNPLWAALVAFACTVIWVKFKHVINDTGSPSNAMMIKPALLVAILVGSIMALSEARGDKQIIRSSLYA